MRAWGDYHEMSYHSEIPRELPAGGSALVHNHIKHGPNTKPGVKGFRSWTQARSEKLVTCDCGWSGLTHYRVIRPAK